MTYGAFTPQDFEAYDRVPRARKPIPQALLCGITLTLSVSVGLWALYGHPKANPTVVNAPPVVIRTAAAPEKPDREMAVPAAILPLRRYAKMLDPAFTSGFMPVTFAKSIPLRAAFELHRAREIVPVVTASIAPLPQIVPQAPAVSTLTTDIPLPAPRPVALLATPMPPRLSGRRRFAALERVPTATPTVPPDHRAFFDKLFGGSPPPNTVLAYAAPEDGGLGSPPKDSLARPFPYDRWTAVYDIAAHTVYLPDGGRLEAHSGLGSRLDDPSGVAVRMRGATPPNVYDLAPREQLFHGVRALRLTPVGDQTTYGRAGLLAHTYMLGPRGDSNGCVVFKNYKAFLQAYDAGLIKRLAVVSRLN